MKKILLLGGSAQQVIAIETAKQLGFYTILCDYLDDNPGQYVADKFYLASTTDKDLILDIATNEKVDGIVAYASDPAAPTAAYVSEKLNLPGNPFNSVNCMCNKDLFRIFLLNNGFNSPKSKGYSSKTNARKEMTANDYFELPVIIKPVDSSGSKGITVLYDLKQLDNALDYAFEYSRSKKIIIEEFIEKKHEYLVGGDLFVKDGQVVLWGLLNCHRDENVNKLVPVGKSYPLCLEDDDIYRIKNTLQSLVTKLNIINGAMNIELVIDKKDRVWLLDIGPRNGGNMIPDLLGYIFDVDIVKMTIMSAMNMEFDLHLNSHPNICYATHNLHSSKSGILESIEFSQSIQQYIFRKNIYVNKGSKVEYFDNASKALGIIFMKFDNRIEMNNILSNINDNIFINLKEGGNL